MKVNSLFLGQIIFFVFFSSIVQHKCSAQSQYYTLEQVIELSLENSIQAKTAKNQYLSSYWNYRSYIASRLPSLNLNTSLPNIDNSIRRQTSTTGEDFYFPRNDLGMNGSISVNQVISLTGAYVYVSSGLNYLHSEWTDLDGSKFSEYYTSNPIYIGINQPLTGFNNYKWEKKIEPLKFLESQKKYITAVEGVSAKAVDLFFNLALAQLNINISTLNYQNNDTLYNIAKGRYNIGTIAQNELLQMELSYLNAKIELKEANLNLDIAKFRLKSFMGEQSNADIVLIMPDKVPRFQVEMEKALQMAKENNPNVIAFQRQLLEAEKNVAYRKSERFNGIALDAKYGLTQTSPILNDAYRKTGDFQGLSLKIALPLLDWGESRGKIKMAQSEQEITNLRIEQEKIDFDQDIFLKVARFNMMADQLDIAAKADTIGRERYEVTKQRFKIGKIDILNLNQAQTEKDVATRNYISTLYIFWQSYYTIRQATLFDFDKNKIIEYDFKKFTN